MFRKEVSADQLLAWIFVAMTAPITQLLAGYNWIYLLIVGAVCTVMVWWALHLTENCVMPKWFLGAQVLWLAAAIAVFSEFTGKSWPMGRENPVIPVVLLILACWSASRGAEMAARVTGVLFFLMVIGYGLILSFGLSQTHWDTLLPDGEGIGWYGVIVLLIPGAALCIPRESLGKKGTWLFALPLFAGIVSMIVGSVLPFAISSKAANPFYEMCRSIKVMGIAGRLEALVCAMVTVGWFSLLSLLFSGIGSGCERIVPGKSQAVMWIVLGAEIIFVFLNVPIKAWIAAVLSALLWIMLPIATKGIERIKKSKKVKKGIDK